MERNHKMIVQESDMRDVFDIYRTLQHALNKDIYSGEEELCLCNMMRSCTEFIDDFYSYQRLFND